MNLKIEEKTAKNIFNESPRWVQEILIETFGKKCFVKRTFKDIKTFEDACEVLGITNDSCKPIFDEEEDPDEIAYKKLKVIARAINGDWEPNWDDISQQKWFPWFNLSSGFGFDLSNFISTYMGTYAGSRLCFSSKEMSDYAGKQFLELYKEFLTITK
jgi:hypothetical protein